MSENFEASVVALGKNEEHFKEWIQETRAKAITSEWVCWMLDELIKAHRRGVLINPEWLRAGKMYADYEPKMIYD